MARERALSDTRRRRRGVEGLALSNTRQAGEVEGPVLSNTRLAGGVEGPWLCLVTDRRRLLRASGRAEEDWQVLLQQQVQGAVRAGLTFVQIRERDLEARELSQLTRSLLELAAGSDTRILVNDRLDVALAAGAHGVHLRADSPAPARVRALTPPGFIVSRSVHSRADIENSGEADFFVAGTMFPTESKADKQKWLGTSGLAAMVRAAGATPVLAIGGVTDANAPEVARSGARGLASIGAFLPGERGEDVGQRVERQAERLRSAFAGFVGNL